MRIVLGDRRVVYVQHGGGVFGTLAGPAEWQSDDAFALIGAALKK